MTAEADIVRAALRARLGEAHTTATRCHNVAIDEPIAALVALIWCATSDIATLRTHAEIDALTDDERGPAPRRRTQADAAIADLLAATVTVAPDTGGPTLTLRLDDLPPRAIADLLAGEVLAMHACAERLTGIADEITCGSPAR